MAYTKCKRMTVHAMGVDKDGELRYARNGNKGKCKNLEGACGCTHAEIALLEQMPNPVSVTVSHAPCENCAKALIEAGVVTVVFSKPYRLKEGVELLQRNGVHVISATGEW